MTFLWIILTCFFQDFYSEESVNNQGLECLRFLNEVISDFDGVSKIMLFGFVFFALLYFAAREHSFIAETCQNYELILPFMLKKILN